LRVLLRAIGVDGSGWGYVAGAVLLFVVAVEILALGVGGRDAASAVEEGHGVLNIGGETMWRMIY
jgi:hypothetical protein